MQRTPPRVLAPPPPVRGRAREHLVVEAILALLAIGLTTAVLLGSVLERPEASAARLPNLLPPAPTTTRVTATAPVPTERPAPEPAGGNLLADPGFESGTAGWRAVGRTRVERVLLGRERWALRLSRESAGGAGALHGEVVRLREGRRYAATAWVRAAGVDTRVQVNLFELRDGKRFAVDSVEAVAGSGGWQRLEVFHDAQRPGAALSLEILAPDLPAGTGLLVDDAAVREAAWALSTP